MKSWGLYALTTRYPINWLIYRTSGHGTSSLLTDPSPQLFVV
jgi:hypothetical protein